MTNHARLIPVSEPRDAEAAVLVLHGGASRQGDAMVSPTQLSVLRMIPIAKRLARSGRRRLAVYRLLNSTRGWNTTHTPVDDAHWAIDQLHEGRTQNLPIGLVGHSLGGRAAILAAGRAEVRSVVALNPWVYPTDGDLDLTGRRVLIAHGTDDRIAVPARSESAARNVARTADVSYVRVEGGKHAMLRRHRTFDGLAADFTATTLLEGARPSGLLRRVLESDAPLEV
ncbi:alpha/beta hydrolase [Aeromicrobium sp. Leaf350]|uniref:alpha/beta hydrolase n=1 Tax=Aeromicrobium sp. Leaf350 TaxID=2876565 RepID=UPI001E649E54|nr:alpha/beta fold hydrolase [Aeromicrobium sp. Leaf350]